MRGRKIIAGLLSVMLVLAAVFAGNATSVKAESPITINVTAEHCTVYYKISDNYEQVENNVISLEQTQNNIQIKVLPEQEYEFKSGNNMGSFDSNVIGWVEGAVIQDAADISGGGISLSNITDGTHTLTITASQVQTNTGTFQVDITNNSSFQNGNSVSYKLGSETNWSQFSSGTPIQIGNNSSITIQVKRADSNEVDAAWTVAENFGSLTIDEGILGENGQTFNLVMNTSYKITVTFSNKSNGQQPSGPNFSFGLDKKDSNDNNLVLVWKGTQGQICYDFVKITNTTSGADYVPNVFKNTDIVDENSQNSIHENYQIGEEIYYVTYEASQDSEAWAKICTNWNWTKDQNDLRILTMDPCGSEVGNSSVTATPDQAFRIIIKEAEYTSVSLESESAATYFPDMFDPVFYIPYNDVTGTSESNPATLTGYFLEPTFTLSTGNGSTYAIANDGADKAVVALDVPSEAVSVTNNDNGTASIVFKSNYYDKVKFKVKDVNGGFHYVTIVRTGVNLTDNFGPDVPISDQKILGTFYYPNTDSASNYNALCTITYTDGSTKTKSVSLQNEDTGGKGLKKASFTAASMADDSVSGKEIKYVSVNIIKAGGDSNTFAGAMLGSGAGATYDVNARKVLY